MQMKTAAFLIFLAAGLVPASAAEPDLSGALEARYGPFPANATVSLDVTSRQPFEDSGRFREGGLPEGFLAIVWDRSNDRFAALVENTDGKAVKISGTASLEASIPVPLRRVAAGETVLHDDVALQQVRLTSSGKYAASLPEVVGKQATRPLAPNRPIAEDSLALPPAVTKNGDVTVVFRKGPLELAAKGKSLGDAALGGTVKVARPSASKVLEGIAVAEGVVLVTEGNMP